MIALTSVAQTPGQAGLGVDSNKRTIPSVRWQGKVYTANDVVPVLLDSLQDRETPTAQRKKALNKLSSLGKLLNGHNRLDELLALYPRLETQEEKSGVLVCLIKSKDPRGLPLFHAVLNQNADPVFQLCAAGGLAEWNVRAGVEKLVDLLNSDIQLSQGRFLADEAANLIRDCNAKNHWGLPEKEFIDAIKSNPEVGRAQLVSQFQKQCLEWLAQHPERFNDWKPGDPPPEVDIRQSPKQGG